MGSATAITVLFATASAFQRPGDQEARGALAAKQTVNWLRLQVVKATAKP